VSQRLIARADGKGMVPACEILVATARVRELIEAPERTREIRDAISQGKDPYGMVTFDQSLAELVQRKLVTYEEALRHSTTPDDFALAFRGVSGGGNQEEWLQAEVHRHNSVPPQPRRSMPMPAHPQVEVIQPEHNDFEIERFKKD